MSVVVLYILMVIFLTWVMVWSQKKSGYDVIVGDVLLYAFIATIPFLGLFMAAWMAIQHVFMNPKVKTIFSSVVVSGD